VHQVGFYYTDNYIVTLEVCYAFSVVYPVVMQIVILFSEIVTSSSIGLSFLICSLM
jgi:hypothetical protein